MKVSLVLTVLVYGGVGVHSFLTLKELAERYPVVSLAERLDYEEKRRELPGGWEMRPAPDSPLVLDYENDNIHQVPDRFSTNKRRTHALQHLHEQSVQAFIESPGFGVARLSRHPSTDIPLPEISSIPQPIPESALFPIPPESLGAILSLDEQPNQVLAEAGRPDGLRLLHSISLRSFINTRGFGYVNKVNRQIAGFQEHHFYEEPGKDENQVTHPWKVQRIELVSLLKHPEPCVYLSDNLPRMDELRKAKTRPLDGFEAARLPNLLKGDDLSFVQTESAVRVLGAIRAAKQCLDCHSVERGDLLGAFSYRLGRASQ